jgi:hypothetical protein
MCKYKQNRCIEASFAEIGLFSGRFHSLQQTKANRAAGSDTYDDLMTMQTDPNIHRKGVRTVPDTFSCPPPPLQQLGDYRIPREIGRGGTGVVYEAEQLSLGRSSRCGVLLSPPGGKAENRPPGNAQGSRMCPTP